MAFFLPDLNPNQTINIDDYINLTKTSFSEVVTANDSEGVPLNISYTVDVAFEVVLTVSAKNMKEIDYKIGLQCFNAIDLDDLVIQYSDFVDRSLSKIRHDTPFFAYIQSILEYSKSYEEDLLIYPEYSPYKEDDNFYTAINYEQKACYYRLYDWNYIGK